MLFHNYANYGCLVCVLSAFFLLVAVGKVKAQTLV